MNYDIIRQAVLRHREKILVAERYIWEHPETGYLEFETDAYMKKAFRDMGYEIVAPNDITGFYTVLDIGREGPTVLVLAELDSLICAAHPDAEPTKGAVHACGHNAQCAAILGVAAALMDMKKEGLLDTLCGRIKLCLVPAEEGVELGYRQKLIEEGKITFTSGKPEFISRRYFDDVDVAFMVHTSQLSDGQSFRLATGSNGVVRKRTVFHGRSAHAGGAPYKGINALNAASTALTAVNSLRETFIEKDYVRFHSIITNGGDAVNAVPETVVVESYVRASSVKALKEANIKINRTLSAVAAAFGANAEIFDFPGSEPLKQNNELNELACDVLDKLVGKEAYSWRREWSASSTDMGDISVLFPCIHPHAGGAVGLAHGHDYKIADPDNACVMSAVFQIAMITELLENGGMKAWEIKKRFIPVFGSIEEYLEHKRYMNMHKNTVVYREDGSIVLDYQN